MKDLASVFLKQGIVSDSQEKYLAGCGFYGEPPLSDDSSSSADVTSAPVESTGINISSAPNHAVDEDECYQTPPEEHTSNPTQQLDCAGDTGLLSSDRNGKNISTLILSDSQESEDLGMELVKNQNLKRKSPLPEVLSTPKMKKVNLDSIIGNDLLNPSRGKSVRRDTNSSPSGRVAEASNIEAPPVKAFVTLDDLLGPLEDDDILVAAIKAGWKFPRPLSWGPEGSQSKAVHKS